MSIYYEINNYIFNLRHMAHNALFFATLKRRAGRASLAGSCCFLIKIENFYQKKQLHSKEALPARLLSVAKNSA